MNVHRPGRVDWVDHIDLQPAKVEQVERFNCVASLPELRARKLADGCTVAEKPIDTPNGIVWLRATNWAAIADVVEKLLIESIRQSKPEQLVKAPAID